MNKKVKDEAKLKINKKTVNNGKQFVPDEVYDAFNDLQEEYIGLLS